MSDTIRGVLGLLAIVGPLLAVWVWALWRCVHREERPPQPSLLDPQKVVQGFTLRQPPVRRPKFMRPAKGRKLAR